MSERHVADTGLFVALGQPTNRRFRTVRRTARREGIRFVVPVRVYEELTADTSAETPPIDAAVDDGWVTVAEPLDFSVPVVSRTMDGVQRHVANADNRRPDEVERADAALGALAAQYLATTTTAQVFVYTTDIAAGNAVERVLASEGYGDSVTFVNGFQFVDEVVADISDR